MLLLLRNRNKYDVRWRVTSKRRLYGGFDEAGQELSGLWFLRQPRTEGSQSVPMAAEALQGYPLSVVPLQHTVLYKHLFVYHINYLNNREQQILS